MHPHADDDQARTGSPEAAISPELALVDPELARAARALLPEPAATRIATPSPVPIAPAEPVATAVELGPPAASGARRRLGRPASLGIAALLVACGFTAGVLVSERSRSQAGQAASPTTAPDTTPATTMVTATTAVTTAATNEPPTLARTTQAPPAAPAGRAFVWAPARDASQYEFQLFRGSTRVFRTRVTEPRFELPGRWPRNGRTDSLKPGTYRWYVWAVSRRTGRQAAAALVQAQLVVE